MPGMYVRRVGWPSWHISSRVNWRLLCGRKVETNGAMLYQAAVSLPLDQKSCETCLRLKEKAA